MQKRLGRNAKLTLRYEENGWGAVEDEELSGFVSLEYLTREEPSANAFVVVIDPGHQRKGDSTPEPNGPESSTMKARVTGGTSGRTTGVMEYELTLAVSLKLRDELEARGYTVFMTRETHDVNISNMERAQYATSAGADVAVRIHANGVEDSSVSGALALTPSASNPYISHLAGDSQRLSQCILDAYCDATGMRNQGVVTSDTMTGINWSTVPVTILEMGYMTNPSDDTNMEDEAYQEKMIQGIADGIDGYFGIG
ncbi:MAG: N-acetylmuramoyl-L-alanine amidase [Lachnospiraceae bacterium]|nr:N-acetylmuramoyl-L-alanine amidase [Lachnospiraceae bacterium]